MSDRSECRRIGVLVYRFSGKSCLALCALLPVSSQGRAERWPESSRLQWSSVQLSSVELIFHQFIDNSYAKAN